MTIGVWWQVHPFMMEAVRQMAQTHPRLKIDFVETSYGNAAEGFAQGLFDLFFSTDSLALRQMGASFTPLSREKYYCVFSPESPWRSARRYPPTCSKTSRCTQERTIATFPSCTSSNPFSRETTW